MSEQGGPGGPNRPAAGPPDYTSLFFILPLGITVVVGGVGRVDTADASFSGVLSFFGFLINLLLRCSPLGTMNSCGMG